MPNIVSTTTPQKNNVRAMQIKALEDRRKAAELAAAKATQPAVIDSPWQGAANMANAFFTARRGAVAAQQEQASRDALAKLRSSWGPEGPNMAQIQEAAQYDEDLANKLQSELQSRNFQRSEREAGQGFTREQQEDTQKQQTSERIAGQVFTQGQNESNHDFELRKQEARNKFEREQADIKVGTDRAAAAEQAGVNAETARVKAAEDAKAAELLAKAKAAEPDSPEGKVYSDYVAKKYGDPADPETQKRFKEAWEKATYIAPPNSQGVTVRTTGYDAQGRPITETTVGPTGKGGTGATSQQGAVIKDIEAFRQQARSATQQNAAIDTMEKSMQNVGPSGPGLEWLGEKADVLENFLSSVTGSDITKSEYYPDFLGTSSARTTMKSGALGFVQKQVENYKGAISDKETQIFQDASPGLGKSKEGNAVLLQIAKEVNKRAQLQSHEAEKWIAANHGLLDGFDDYWRNYMEQNPILSYGDTGGLVVGGKPLGSQSLPQAPATAAPASNPDLDNALKLYQ